MTEEEMDDLVRTVWERNRPQVMDRIRVIRAAADALAAEVTSGPTCVDLLPAFDAAHQLTGSLGSLGHPWASEVAIGLQAALVDTANDGFQTPAIGAARIHHLLSRLQDMLKLDG